MACYSIIHVSLVAVLAPFIGASLVTAIHTLTVPGIAESVDQLESQVYRQMLVYDFTLATLQRIACRYRGNGSPFDPNIQPCSTAELTTYYASLEAQASGQLPRSVPFVDPSARPTDAQGSPLRGHKWVQRFRANFVMKPIPSRMPQFDSRKAVKGRMVRPSLDEQAAAAAYAAAGRKIINFKVPPTTHTLWLALPDSDEFMVG